MPFYTIRSGEIGVQPYRVGGPISSGSRYVARESDGTLWVAFTTRIDYPVVGLRAQITIAYSTDGGLTWTDSLLFEDSDTINSYPRIVIDSEDTLHLTVLRRYVTAGWEAVQYTYKTLGGAWQALVSITGAYAPATYPGAREDIALDSADNIHRVTGHHHNPSTLRYDYKPYGGAWQASVNLDTKAGDFQIAFANICVDDNDTLHVTYEKQTAVNVWNVFYISRIAGVWGAPVQVTAYVAVDVRSPLAIAVTPDGIVYSPFDHGGASTRCVVRSAAGVWTNEGVSGLTVFRQGHLTINPDGTLHFAWHRLAAAVNYYYNENARTGGVWNGIGQFYNWVGAANSYALGGLWANWPQIGGIRTNIPRTGWCCVAGRETELDVAFYLPAGGMVFDPIPPTVTTDPATDIVQELATLNGTLDLDGGEACDCGFEWGLTVAYGNTTPTQSRGTGESFSQVIAGLSYGTTYHFRALATNPAGTSYGADETFTTLEGSSINKAYPLAREEL